MHFIKTAIRRVIPDSIRNRFIETKNNKRVLDNLSLKQTKKLLRVMQLTAIILLTTCLAASAAGHTQGVTLKLKDAPLEKVFSEIRKQTGYNFLFSSKELKDAGKVTVQVSSASVEQVLSICFKDKPFTWVIDNNTIVVKRNAGETKQNPNADGGSEQLPPPIDVKGKITNEAGEPVPASIIVKGTQQGTTTNADGYFELKNVDENATLVISGVSIETKEVRLNGKSELVIAATTKVSPLDEMQVIAYGTRSKRLQTGNVSTVKADAIAKQPVNNSILALEGRVPGLFIQQNTGIPGGGITIRIQGQNSLNRGSDPLYVIDGVPFASQMLPNISSFFDILGANGNTNPTYAPSGNGNPLSFINPADIESIDVLKDADATAIYGSRAANGAILITTKRGKSGKTTVDFNIQNGWGKVTRMLDLMNTQQYLGMRHETLKNDGTLPGPNDFDINGTWDSTRYTDWQKTLIGGTAHYTDGQVSVSGGTGNTNFLVGAGYHYETSVFPGDLSDQKKSLHFNINNVSSNQKFRLQLSGNYILDDNHLISTDFTPTAIRLAPNAPALYNSDGTLNWAESNGSSTWYNPLAYTYKRYTNKTNNLIGNALISYQIIPGLDIKSSFGYNSLGTDEIVTAQPLKSVPPENRPFRLRASFFDNSKISSWIVEPQFTYRRKISRGTIEALLGSTWLQNDNNQQLLRARGFNSDLVMEDIKAASSFNIFQSLASKYRYSALFSRVNYNWQNKFIINLTARRDGSSRFGSENSFHNFGSIGGAWIFSNETSFQKTMRFVSFGKLRASYGTTGNDQIGDYQFMNLYDVYGVPVAYQGATGLLPTSLPNPHLQWEETKKLQLGIDLGFLKNHILINANYYNNRSSNLLQGYALPLVTGNSDIQMNFPAIVQNSGWELAVNTTNIQRSNFLWNSSLNFTSPRNRLVEFPNLATSSYANAYVIGQSITIRKGFHFAGINPTTGLYQFTDKSGNITSAPNFSSDRTALINIDPKFYGGIENSFRYKVFTLDFLFQFTKQRAFSYSYGDKPGFFYSDNSGSVVGNQPNYLLDRWQKSGDNAAYQRFSANPAIVYSMNDYITFSDANYSDASYIRLKNISLSWQLLEKWRQKAHFQNARIYVQGQNLLTITHYKGMDPENANTNNLPPLKILTLGIQIVL